MNLHVFLVIGFERPIERLVKMDQNGHDLAGPQLACSLKRFARSKLAGFPLWRKTEHEIIDIAKQFQYTHFYCDVAYSTLSKIAKGLEISMADLVEEVPD